MSDLLHQLLTTTRAQLTENDFLSGGFILMALGSIVALMRHIPGRIFDFLRRQLSVRVEIRDPEVVGWVDVLLGQEIQRRRVLKAAAMSDPDTHERVPRLSHGYGRHFIRRNGKIFLVDREFVSPTGSNGDGDGSLSSLLEAEEVKIQCLGRSSKHIERLLVDAAMAALKEDKDREGLLAYINCGGSYWERFDDDGLERRSLESVILDGDLKERVTDDLREFLDVHRKSWYVERGVPYRRGYLLHGPPGGGKSSLVRALCSEFQLKLYVLDLSASKIGDADLARLMAGVNRGSAILIEDVDCLSMTRQRAGTGTGTGTGEGDGDGESHHERSRLTLSGLLNALDGVIAGEGRVVFMTSNYPEKIDRALVRPGRVDLEVRIGDATVDQARRMFLKFFPGREMEAVRFAAPVEGRKVSMATLQGVLIQNSEDAVAASRWESEEAGGEGEVEEEGDEEERQGQINDRMEGVHG